MKKEKAKKRQKDCPIFRQCSVEQWSYEATAEEPATLDEALGQVARGESANES